MPSFNEPDVSDKPAWVEAHPALSDDQIALLDELPATAALAAGG